MLKTLLVTLIAFSASFASACLVFENGFKVCPGSSVYYRSADGAIRLATLRAINPNDGMVTVQPADMSILVQVASKTLAVQFPSLGGVKLGETVYHEKLSQAGTVKGFNPFNGRVIIRSNSNSILYELSSCELGLTNVCLYYAQHLK